MPIPLIASETREQARVAGEIATIPMPVNPISVALASNASFIARTFAGHQNETKEIIKRAILHKGFSFINDFSPCVTFNKVNTYDWFRERCYYIEKELPGHDATNKLAAYALAEDESRLALGVFYRVSRPTPTDLLPDTPIVDLSLADIDLSAKAAM